MVSFSPEQMMETWYEKAAIPYIYLRLGSRFRFAEVNDPDSNAAAANGQFILIRRDVYDEVGGHASVAANVLEDVGLATRVKQAGHRIWFGSGKGIVRVRMYRTFPAMWEGWKKNLYTLMGGTPQGGEIRIGTSAAAVTALAPCSDDCLAGNGIGVVGIRGLGGRPGRTSLRLRYGTPTQWFFAGFADLWHCRPDPVRSDSLGFLP